MTTIGGHSPTAPNFQPWIGEKYTLGIGGVRILIVGESHHGPAHQNDDCHFTKTCIERVIDGSWKLRFYRNLHSLFAHADTRLRTPATTTGRAEFWNRVGFYNLIQEVISGPKRAPSPAVWERGVAPFRSVLRSVAPDLVLFAGKRLFFTVSPWFEAAAPIVHGNERRHALLLPCGEARAIGSFVLHPSYGGYRKQSAWAARMIERARL